MTGVLRVVQRNLLVYRHTWRGSLFTSFLQPALFLLSMGLGVGSLVDAAGTTPAGIGTLGFLAFVAPGLMAGSCMQTGTFEASYPIMGKFAWQRTYEAIGATPLRIREIVLGELAWIALRLATMSATFLLVMTWFGVPRSPLAVMAIPAAVLTGLAFSAPMAAFAATIRNDNSFNIIFRFVTTPLFLFSGIFFPVSQLPPALRAVAPLTPLYHGVALTRGAVVGGIGWSDAAAHAGYLLVMLAIGVVLAFRQFTRKLYV